MRLTKTSAQAALAMAYLASRTGEGPVQARHVAEHLGIPTDSALKILQALARQGLIQSQLGRSGGYLVTTPAEQITLLQIVEAIDGPINAHMPIRATKQTLISSIDVLQNAYEQATQQIRMELSRTTVENLAGKLDPTTIRVAG